MTETREKTVCRLPELKERHLPGDCREAVYTLLKETYGYEQFRDLEVYDDLFKGKDTLQISAPNKNRSRHWEWWFPKQQVGAQCGTLHCNPEQEGCQQKKEKNAFHKRKIVALYIPPLGWLLTK